jgi:nucleotide sugar dehydrogenase
MKVCVIGLGQIGFPVATYLKGKGLEVYGYDINSATAIRAEKDGKINATNQWSQVPKVDVYIISVTTGQINDAPDLSAVFDVSKKIAEKASKDTLVSIESTITPGTSTKIFKEIFHRKVRLIHAPHRYWADEPEKHGVNQIRVIGGINEESLKDGLKFYKDTLGIPMHPVPDIEVAEMCKIAENSHRYLQIAFAEDLKMLCNKVGMDFNALREAMNTKWNVDLPEAREGIGRHCLPKDIRYVMSLSSDSSLLLGCAVEVDKKYREWLTKQASKDKKS